MSVFKITPKIQPYDWGKKGNGSKVAQFASAAIPNFKLDESSPYAELWMGTHSTAPSTLAEGGGPLADYLKTNPQLIGQRIIEQFDAASGNLPFLFKVLSIEKALSIQSHPDKATAEELHAKQPDIYKDANHKPEMALAITPFRALCGFRPLAEISIFLRVVPELAQLIPATVVQTFISISSGKAHGIPEKIALKNLFSAIMTAEEAMVKRQLRMLVARYNSGGANAAEGETEELVELVIRLNSQFPDDIGVFCAFLLNYVQLEPGQAIFLGAGEPHAYIHGECMECMANSDNVIRAGLTPKLRDVPNLVSTLTYNSSQPSKHLVNPRPFSVSKRYSTLYDPPIPEFSVVRVELPRGEAEKHPKIDGPSIAIITEGNGRVMWNEAESLVVGIGDVFFIGAGTELIFESDAEKLVMHRAFAE